MILSRVKISPQQRYDLEEFFAQLAAARSDSKLYTQKFLSEDNLVLGGFTVSGIGLNAATVNVANAALIVPENSSDFSYFISAPSDTTVLIPDADLVDNTRNYVEMELTVEDGTPLTKAFWDPEANSGAGAEFNQIVNTITDLRINFITTTSGFSGLPDRLPLCIIDTDGSGIIKVILDRRELYGRLAKPNDLDNDYNWGTKVDPTFALTMTATTGTFLAGEIITIGGETATVTTGGTSSIAFNEPTGINFSNGDSVVGATSGATGTVNTVAESFSGVDKSLNGQKEINDAIMTEIKTMKGTRFWWEDALTSLEDAGDEWEDRSGYIRSDDPVSWDGVNLSFTSDLILEFVDTKSGVTSQHVIDVANSPITLNDEESAYVKIDRSLTTETCTLYKSDTDPIPPQSAAERGLIVLFRRKDALAGNFLHIPFHKQIIEPGQTIRLGSSGLPSSVSVPPLFEQETPSGDVDGVNDTFTISHSAKTTESIFVVVDDLKIPDADVTLVGTTITIAPASIPQVGQSIEVFYIAETDNTIVGNQEVPSGAIDGVNDTFTIAGTAANAESVLVFVDGLKSDASEWSLSGSNQIIFNAGSIPQVGQSVEVFYVTALDTTIVFQETPSGTVDGFNDTFDLSSTPPYKNAAVVFVDGRKVPLAYWSLLIVPSPAIKFSVGFVPQPGQHVEVFYFVVASGAVTSLQQAYNNGNTIVTTVGNPLTVGGAAAKVAQFNGDIGVTGVIDPAGMTFTPQSSTPLGGSDNGLWVNTSGDLIHSRPSMPDVNVTQSAAGNSSYIEKFTLSPTDISNKYVTLANAPTSPSDVLLTVIGGVMQDYSVDFTVTGSTLSWSSLGLDGVLSSGDKLVIQYN